MHECQQRVCFYRAWWDVPIKGFFLLAQKAIKTINTASLFLDAFKMEGIMQ